MSVQVCGVALAILASSVAGACSSEPLSPHRTEAMAGTASGGSPAGSTSAASSSGSPTGGGALAGSAGSSPSGCASPDNGVCDEPFLCEVGTDPDCCATPGDGVCEEKSKGGACPDQTDWFDCGYCTNQLSHDGFCSEPFGCPVGTDDDCCGTPHDGVCDEASQGGSCEDGSDWFDCGYCPNDALGDGICEEPDLCPQGSDGADCCAHFGDGVCEEASKGGPCSDGSDWYDCGYCPERWLDDGVCDEFQQGGGNCPANTDPLDCCASWRTGTCEEVTLGGECDALSDYYDCGYCPAQWVADGNCDETDDIWACPPGSDAADCK